MTNSQKVPRKFFPVEIRAGCDLIESDFPTSKCNAIIDPSAESSLIGSSILEENPLSDLTGSNNDEYWVNLRVLTPDREYHWIPDESSGIKIFRLKEFADKEVCYDLVISKKDLYWIRNILKWEWFPHSE